MTWPRSILCGVAGFLLALIATGANNGELAAQAAFAIRDSAGVPIVVNSGPAWSGGAEWRLGTRPILRIGAVEGDPNQMLERVRGATRMDDGTIVVLEGGTNELRLFDSGGNFLRNLGGTGEGPGEFRFLTEMWVTGDTIIHGSTWRIDRYSRDGRFMNGIAFVRESDRWGHDIPGVPSFPYLPLSLGIGPYAASGEHVFTGDPATGSVERRSADGELTRVIRWPVGERRITAQGRSRYREASAGPPQGINSAGWNRYLQETPFPDRMPAYSRLLVDAPGNLWVERYRPPWEDESSWFVFDERGVWLGELATPPDLSIFEVGADNVLGLERDGLGVPFVVMYPLVRENCTTLANLSGQPSVDRSGASSRSHRSVEPSLSLTDVPRAELGHNPRNLRALDTPRHPNDLQCVTTQSPPTHGAP